MSTTNITSDANDIGVEAHYEPFADPVAYLALFGIEAELHVDDHQPDIGEDIPLAA